MLRQIYIALLNMLTASVTFVLALCRLVNRSEETHLVILEIKNNATQSYPRRNCARKCINIYFWNYNDYRSPCEIHST